MRIRRTLAGLTVLAATTGSLTACGASDDAKDASATSTASASPSASSDTGGHLDRAELVEAITDGQLKAGSAHVAMKMTGSLSMTAQGDVSYKGSSPAMSMKMSLAQLGKGQLDMRLLDGVIYMSIPPMTPAGKFVKIDPKDTSNPLSKSFGSLTQQMDPLSSARALKKSVRTVKFVGNDTVDGTPTEHYRVGVDTAALMKTMKTPAAAGVPKTINYDMWLDGKRLLRRMKFALSGFNLNMTMSDWGKPVSVQAPPADKLVDPSKLSGMTTGS